MRLHRLILPAFVVATTILVAPLSGGVASSETPNREMGTDDNREMRAQENREMGSAEPENREMREVFSEDGSIAKVSVPKSVESFTTRAAVVADIVTIQQTGPSSERFDLVFVGDGYTAAEMGAFHDHVVGKWNELAAVEPFKAFKPYFNVWQVNAVSAESGVDNDPSVGINRNTALGLGFWCKGIERLLCAASDEPANQYAALAPGSDQVIVLGNTAKYGGAGGGVATAAGANAQAGQIVVHELGHSIGKLADEYFPLAPDDTTYTGGELEQSNVSTRADGSKWSQYLGQPSPDGGVVGVYEGGRNFTHGVYRPTENSIMRTLGRPFNLPGRDAMIAAFKTKIKVPN